MRAVITVVGKDAVGILAKVSTCCAEANANIVDVTQTVMDAFFTMTMLVEIDQLTLSFEDFQTKVAESVPDMKVRVMHEKIFDSMHRI